MCLLLSQVLVQPVVSVCPREINVLHRGDSNRAGYTDCNSNPTHEQFPFVPAFFKSLKDGFIITSAVDGFSWISSCMHLFSSLRKETLTDRSHS